MKVVNLNIGLEYKLLLIAGPCVLENEQLAIDIAGYLKEITNRLEIQYIFKSSFLKANRSSIHGYVGPGIEEGMKIFERIKKLFNIPILTDVHEDTNLDEISNVVDVLQTPAFLCRQTNFILRIASTMKPLNIKKGQFLSPFDMKYVVEKAKSTGNNNIMVCERGASFGYNNLVLDMRSLIIMRDTECPIICDVTHSLQLPGAYGNSSGGNRELVPHVARASVGVGISGIFMETHIDPERALSDGANSIRLHDMKFLLEQLVEIDKISKRTND